MAGNFCDYQNKALVLETKHLGLLFTVKGYGNLITAIQLFALVFTCVGGTKLHNIWFVQQLIQIVFQGFDIPFPFREFGVRLIYQKTIKLIKRF